MSEWWGGRRVALPWSRKDFGAGGEVRDAALTEADEQTDGGTDGRTNARTNEPTPGAWMNEWMNGVFEGGRDEWRGWEDGSGWHLGPAMWAPLWIFGDLGHDTWVQHEETEMENTWERVVGVKGPFALKCAIDKTNYLIIYLCFDVVVYFSLFFLIWVEFNVLTMRVHNNIFWIVVYLYKRNLSCKTKR